MTGTFYICRHIVSVIIPRTVQTIGDKCFFCCHRLNSVTFESGSELTSIEASAFSLCSSLESMLVPPGVQRLGEGCFNYCYSLCNVTFEQGSRLAIITSFIFFDCKSLEYVLFCASDGLRQFLEDHFNNPGDVNDLKDSNSSYPHPAIIELNPE